MGAVTSQHIINAIQHAVSVSDNIIYDLDDLYKEMKKVETKRDVGKTVGTVANVAGAAAIIAAPFTGGLSLIGLGMVGAGTAVNIGTDFYDDSETKDCIERIKSLLKKFDEEMKVLQRIIDRFNNQVEETMKIKNFDRRQATIIELGSPGGVDAVAFCLLASSKLMSKSMTLTIESCLVSVSKSLGLSVVKAGAETAGKIIGKVSVITGVIYTAWEVKELISILTHQHPTLETIEKVTNDVRMQKAKLQTALKELQTLVAAVKVATKQAIIDLLKPVIGNEWYQEADSVLTPLTFPAFVDQIGRGTEGSIYHLTFMAEMLERPIEVFDRTTDSGLERHHGTSHLKMYPFGPSSRDSIRIELSGGFCNNF